ncbi:hypothetical protein KP509_23G034600 [Ceratopteris richardii]|nr:hypothetical protein KP509_23G034600 [Ceratopteris richardii]
MMSQPLDSLQIGEMIDVKGPLGHIHYLGKGFCEIDEKRFHMNVCAMLAGGTGITPMYQLIRKVLDDPDDLTQIFLIYANRTEEDIMLRKELDKLAEENPSQFQLWYMLSSPPQDHDWEYGTGRINEEVIKAHFPPPFLEPTIFLCGPPPMLHEACYPNLTKLGYTTGSIFEF